MKAALGAAAVLLGSALVAPSALPVLPLCLLKRLTGFDCPGCGLTRSFVAISHGDLAAAWAFNPLGFVAWAAALCLAAAPLLSALLAPRWSDLLVSRGAGGAAAAAVAAVWMAHAIRMVLSAVAG